MTRLCPQRRMNVGADSISALTYHGNKYGKGAEIDFAPTHSYENMEEKMAYNFSADEIFEMAKQIEINGAAFYRKAAEKVEGEKEKKFLNGLAHMEDQHEKIFEQMQKEFNEQEKDSQMYDPEGEAVLYLKALADTKIFFKKEEPGKNMKDILMSAIKAEQDSIIFYLGMKELVSGDKGKKRVDDIIKEEMSHIQLLSGKLNQFA